MSEDVDSGRGVNIVPFTDSAIEQLKLMADGGATMKAIVECCGISRPALQARLAASGYRIGTRVVLVPIKARKGKR